MEIALLVAGYLVIGFILGLVSIHFDSNADDSDAVGFAVFLTIIWLPLLGTAIGMSPILLMAYIFGRVRKVNI